MNNQVDSTTSEGKRGGNALSEPEVNKSTETNIRAGVAEKRFVSRRSFLGKSLAIGAGTMGAGLFANNLAARTGKAKSFGHLDRGDAAILRFLAAAEIIET